MVFSIESVSKEYRSGTQVLHALDSVSLKIEDGEIFGIIGKSGVSLAQGTPKRGGTLVATWGGGEPQAELEVLGERGLVGEHRDRGGSDQRQR